MKGQDISANETDLLSFFEVEPKPRDPREPWPYNDFLYQTNCGKFHVSFSIEPACKDIHRIVSLDGRMVYELNAVGVADVRYSKDAIGERLEIVVNLRETLSLRLRPELVIEQMIADKFAR